MAGGWIKPVREEQVNSKMTYSSIGGETRPRECDNKLSERGTKSSKKSIKAKKLGRCSNRLGLQQATFHLTERQKHDAQTINVHHEGTRRYRAAKNGLQAKTDRRAQVEPNTVNSAQNATRPDKRAQRGEREPKVDSTAKSTRLGPGPRWSAYLATAA